MDWSTAEHKSGSIHRANQQLCRLATGQDAHPNANASLTRASDESKYVGQIRCDVSDFELESGSRIARDRICT